MCKVKRVCTRGNGGASNVFSKLQCHEIISCLPFLSNLSNCYLFNMAFITTPIFFLTRPLPSRTPVAATTSLPRRAIGRNQALKPQACLQSRDESTNSSSSAPIPGSLDIACSHAVAAAQAACGAGVRRMFIEIDTTAGDATYTLLKNSIPIARQLLPIFPSDPTGDKLISVLLPDSGAAALAKRDWPKGGNFRLEGMEQRDIADDVDGVMIVSPRASEVDRLCSLIDDAGDRVVVLINPDLVDMGVTGLSLNARRLRKSLTERFDTVYYLKTFGWGVLLRAYPGKWGIWVDDPGSAVGFRLINESSQRPDADTLDEVLDTEFGNSGGSPVDGLFAKFQRFLSVYKKG